MYNNSNIIEEQPYNVNYSFLLSSQYRKYISSRLNSPASYSSSNSQLSSILEGHLGCVNTLNWSNNGNLLLSGSDDQCLIVHKYTPEASGNTFKLLKRFQTAHANNVFSAKFNPVSEDKIVSAAGDGTVCIVDDWSSRGFDLHNTRTLIASPTGYGAMKIEFIDSNVFLVGCDDGTVVQFDLREEKPGRVIKLNLVGQQVGIHSISKCPSAPHLLSVAGTDPFLRFYDLRSINSQNNLFTWTPPLNLTSKRRSTFPTGVKFGRFGYNLAANYMSDGAFLIDPINQTDSKIVETLKEGNVIKKPDLEVEFGLWERISELHKCGHFSQAESYLRQLILEHKHLQNDKNWCEILAYEVFNRILCLAQFEYLIPSIETIKEDLMMVIDVLNYWPAKYLLVMYLLTLGLIEHAEAMCEMFLKSSEEHNDWSSKLESIKSILMVCELDPAQIYKLIPNSFYQVCSEIPLVDMKTLPSTRGIISSNFHGYLGHFTGHIHERTIKGISFVGDQDQYIGVGSDGGYAFLFDINSGIRDEVDKCPVWAAKSDTSIVNSIESHPFLPILAVSGIDCTIKIWEPSFLSSNPKESTIDFKAFDCKDIPQLMKDLPELQGINRIELSFDPNSLLIYLTR